MIQQWHQKETDHASVGWLLRHIAKLHRQVSKAKMPYRPGEDPGQPVILLVMQDSEDMGNTISQNDLAHSLHVSNPTVTASLKSLERQGYIERKPDPGDMRRKLPALTEQGKQAASECRRCIESVSEEMLGGFSEAERQQLISFLRRMKDNLEQCER